MESTSGNADHLVVLVHGLWGQPSHLEYLSKTLRESYDKDQLHILVAKSNSNYFTYDGIETGGERITHEIEAEIEKLKEQGKTIRKMSVIGYSMGGLVARYAIGLMYSAGLFETVEPINFTTFATPHLGVRAPLIGKASRVWNVLGARTLSTSGQQMFLVDKFRDTNRPLLSVLADPKSVFIRALSQFSQRSLYANILNDRSVTYYTAAISSTDPFADLARVQLHHLPNTDSVILDPDYPVSHKLASTPPFLSRLRSAATTAVTSIPWLFFMTFLLPFGAMFFLASAGVQSIKSAQRRKLHDSGKAGLEVEKYRSTPFIVDEFRSMTDRLYNTAANTVTGGEEYLPTPPSEEAEASTKADGSSSETLLEDKSKSKRNSDGSSKTRQAVNEKFPTLALTEEQFEMIHVLDEVGFKKYRVHITAVRHTHAAIVVRTPWRPGFGQGRTVVKHWVDAFVL